MTPGFGSDNLIFVPRGSRLAVWDAYLWRRIAIDTPGARVRMRPAAVAALDMRIEEALAAIQAKGAKRRDAADRVAAFRLAAEKFVDGLREDTRDAAPAPEEAASPGGLTLWVRVGDVPAESFFAEDYDEARTETCAGECLRLYGSCVLSELDDLDIPFPGRGEDAAFELLLPGGGLRVETPRPDEPLPLVHEYCGSQGVSARGNTVNVTPTGTLEPSHLGCTPVGRAGDGAFATLYFSLGHEPEGAVAARLTPRQAAGLPALLTGSHFRETRPCEGCRVFLREGDAVHLYEGLAGKETLGLLTMPPFALVSASAGSAAPGGRARLLETILGTLGAG